MGEMETAEANWSYTGIHNPHVFFLQLFITTRCKNYAEYSHLAKILLQEARVPSHENGRRDTTSTRLNHSPATVVLLYCSGTHRHRKV